VALKQAEEPAVDVWTDRIEYLFKKYGVTVNPAGTHPY